MPHPAALSLISSASRSSSIASSMSRFFLASRASRSSCEIAHASGMALCSVCGRGNELVAREFHLSHDRVARLVAGQKSEALANAN